VRDSSSNAYVPDDQRAVRSHVSQERGKTGHRKQNCEYQQPGHDANRKTKHKGLPFPPCSGLFASFISPRNFFSKSARELFPLLHVSDPVLVACDRHFRAIRQRLAILAPRTNTLAHPALLETHLPGAILTTG